MEMLDDGPRDVTRKEFIQFIKARIASGKKNEKDQFFAKEANIVLEA